MKEISDGIFQEKSKLYTQNLVPGKKVYGEQLVKKGGVEYREWVPERSKLAAAIMNGLEEIHIKKGSIVLYLGAASGTTVSHISDIIRKAGIVYSLEFSERVFRHLIETAEQRKNIAPLFADARMPEDYAWAELCDVVYCDIAQPDQTEIALRNAELFLEKSGFLYVVVKARSIDVVRQPGKIFEEEAEKIRSAGYRILHVTDLEPYEDSHAMIVAEKS